MSPNAKPSVLVFGTASDTADLCALLVAQGLAVARARLDESAHRAATSQRPNLIVAEGTLPGDESYRLIQKLRGDPRLSHVPILMLSSKQGIADKTAAYQAGVDDYVTKPFHAQEVYLRIKALLARSTGPLGAQLEIAQNGRVIALFSPKGGVGKTTLSVNLAIAFQKRLSKPVGLMDADLFFSNVGVLLNLPISRTIVDFVAHLDDMDESLVNQILARHASGVRVLLGPPHPKQAELITPDDITKTLTCLSRQLSYLVVDCQPSYDERILRILDRADDILLVVTPEIGPFRNISIFLDMAASIGIASSKIKILLNRSNSQVGIEDRHIERTLGLPVSYRVVSGGRAVVGSTNRGTPLIQINPDHPFSKQIFEIADSLAHSDATVSASAEKPKAHFGFELGAKARASLAPAT